MGKKFRILLFTLLTVAFIALSVSLYTTDNIVNEPSQEADIQYDNNSVAWEGEQQLDYEKIPQENIAIPCFDRLILNAKTKNQKVNIYNPEENNCLMVFTLFVDDKQVWKSDYCRPSEGFYDIVLDEELETGVYQGSLLHECYTYDNQKLNSANVKIGVVVQ